MTKTVRQSNEIESIDARDDLPIFIHSQLDDYGLDPVEFRIYARLARRAGKHGSATESIPNMAKVVRRSGRTVQRVLKFLTLTKLTSRIERPGKTDRYILNPASKWVNKSKIDSIRVLVYGKSGDTSVTTDTRDSGDTGEGSGDTTDMGVVTPQTDEGTPLKVLHKGTPTKQPLPRLPGSDDDLDENATRYRISQLKDPAIFGYDLRAELKQEFPSLVFEGPEDYYLKWFLNRTSHGGIRSLKPGSRATLRQYHADLKYFLQICVENQNKKLTNGVDTSNTYRSLGKDTEDPVARRKRENCPDCFGTNSQRVTQDIDGREVVTSRPCKHENSPA